MNTEGSKWVDPTTINQGKEFSASDGVTISDINAIIEDLKYLKENAGTPSSRKKYDGTVVIV